MPSVAKRNPPSNDICAGAQLCSIPEADDDMTDGAIDSGVMADAATTAVAAANQGDAQHAALLPAARSPLPEDVQRAEAFQVFQLLLTLEITASCMLLLGSHMLHCLLCLLMLFAAPSGRGIALTYAQLHVLAISWNTCK